MTFSACGIFKWVALGYLALSISLAFFFSQATIGHSEIRYSLLTEALPGDFFKVLQLPQFFH